MTVWILKILKVLKILLLLLEIEFEAFYEASKIEAEYYEAFELRHKRTKIMCKHLSNKNYRELGPNKYKLTFSVASNGPAKVAPPLKIFSNIFQFTHIKRSELNVK